MTTPPRFLSVLPRHALFLIAAIALGGGCADESIADGDDDETFRGTISTYYLGAGSWHRKICALQPPEGTYNAEITSKTLLAGKCENMTGILQPVPEETLTTEFCAELGLQLKVVAGGVHRCVTTESVSVAVYCYSFSGSNVEVNYKVVDVGDGVLLGSSGWQPALGNGCPRDGFPW